MPIIRPIMLPNGQAFETKELQVTTKEPNPILVPNEGSSALALSAVATLFILTDIKVGLFINAIFDRTIVFSFV